MTLIAAVVPFMLACLGFELMAELVFRRGYYRRGETFASIGCALLEQLTDGATWAVLLPLYSALYKEHRLFTLSESRWSTWAWGLLLVDLCSYAWHRSSHRFPLLWSLHVVHHQSADYNFSTGLRNAMLHRLFVLPFFLPLPILGIPLRVTVPLLAFHAAYQYVLHTRYIPKLGLLEGVLATPSSHRVHHGKNAEYLDRNFGGVFMLWDRLFRSYEPEEAPVVFGTLENLRTQNPLKLNYLPIIGYFRSKLAGLTSTRACQSGHDLALELL